MEGKMANVYFFNQECILDTDKKKNVSDFHHFGSVDVDKLN